MVRFAGHLENLLCSASENPAAHSSQLAVLSEQERRKILGEWNDTERSRPKSSLPELFQQQAVRTPDAVALIDGERKITYRHRTKKPIGSRIICQSGGSARTSWLAFAWNNPGERSS